MGRISSWMSSLFGFLRNADEAKSETIVPKGARAAASGDAPDIG